MSAPTVNLHVIEDRAGRRAMFGPRQADWLLEAGLVELVRFEQTSAATGIRYYAVVQSETVDELNARTLEVYELLECDFCPPSAQATHRLEVRPSMSVDMAAIGRTPLGRPVFACGECAELIRDNGKVALIARVMDKWVARGLERGVPPGDTHSAIGPTVAGFVRAVFANRAGAPAALESGTPPA